MLSSKLALLIFLASTATVHVNAHGYLESPRSRNYVANQDGSWGTGDQSTPKKETCHHCLNGGGAANSGQCGITGNVNYDFPPNASGGVMPTNIQATYEKGQEIDVSIKITAHHKGHFEFYVCPIEYGQAPTRNCFWSHPLEYVKDLKYGAPKDPNHPYRAYIPPSTFGDLNYSYRLKLPSDVSGNLVLLQWWWVSANSCKPSGYDQYNFPAAWGQMGSSLGSCNVSPDGTINGAEQFWNCAEVQILDDGSPGSPQTPAPSTSSPTASPVRPTTPAPTTPKNENNPTATPSMSPTEEPVVVYGNYCGSSWIDAGDKCGIPCPTGNSTVCSYGQHCYADVTCTKTTTNTPTDSPTDSPTNTPVQSPTKPPSEVVGTCGGGKRGNGACPNPAHCCSKWGYCGTGDAWCGRRRGLRAL